MSLTISKSQIPIHTPKLTTLVRETTQISIGEMTIMYNLHNQLRQNYQKPQSYLAYVPPPRKTLEDRLHSFIEKQESINNQTMQTLTNLTEIVSKLTSSLTMHEKGNFMLNLNKTPRVNNTLKWVIQETKIWDKSNRL